MRLLKLRHKLILSQVVLMVFFIIASFPLVERTIRNIVFESLDVNTQDLIDYLTQATNEQKMINRLKEQQSPIFYRVTLYDDIGDILYDSQLARPVKNNFVPYYPPTREAVLRDLDQKRGFFFEDSIVNKKRVLFFTNAFAFHGKRYILTTTVANQHVDVLERNFNGWFITFSLITWLFFSGITWFILYRLHRPIQHIIDCIKPYQSGNRDEIPEIITPYSKAENDEFNQLALTLNALSSRVREQLSSLKDERNEKEAILESLGEGVLAIDGSGVVRYINSSAAKYLGMQKEAIKKRKLENLTQNINTPFLSACIEALTNCQISGKTTHKQLLLTDPKRIHLELIAAPKTQTPGAILVIQDTSVHHKMLEMGKDFVANASHELRTPITIIRGFAETLQDMPTLPTPVIVDITEKIMRNCQRMENLVKNLLLLADIENIRSTHFSPFDLISLLEETISMTKSIYPDALIHFKNNGDPAFAIVDPDLFELAVLNLLSNASKYSREKPQITLSLLQNEKTITIQIKDCGIGIPEADIEHVFERFYTVDKAHSRKLGGAGLGLSIVKTIIDKHSGTIQVESTIGIGSTFTITLPVPSEAQKKELSF